MKQKNQNETTNSEPVANSTQQANEPNLLEIARLRLVLSKFQSVTDWLLAQFNISARRYQALLLLLMNEADGGMIISELGTAIGIKRNTCTELLNRMEADGLVHRIRQLQDRREVKISLTPAGRALVTKIADADRKRLTEIEQEMRALMNVPESTIQ